MIADVQYNAYGTPQYDGVRMSKVEFLNWTPADNYVYEFDNGLLEPTVSMRQDEIALLKQMTRRFSQTSYYAHGGELFAEVDVWLTDIQMRRPDVAYYSSDEQQRLKNGERVVPSFVIEFASVTDQEAVSIKKRHEYFAAGVKVVWWIFPIYQEVFVYTSPTDVSGHQGGDRLNAAPALPDFHLTVADLFA